MPTAKSTSSRKGTAGTSRAKRAPLPENLFELVAEEAHEIATHGLTDQRVHVPEMVNVRALRESLGLTQAQFAERFGFGLHAVQKWEQGTRQPEGAARILLMLIATDVDSLEVLLKKAGLAA